MTKRTFTISTVTGVVVQVVCALLLLSTAALAADRNYLWQSREQFVALERPASDPSKPVQPNEHPAKMSAEKLTGMLSSITYRSAGSQKAEPLLTEQSIQALAPLLQEALQQAQPGEDVTFAVIGLYSSLHGFAKTPRVTTGRVFVRSGTLNVIFGLLQQEVRDRDDRRLYPFTPGSRDEIAAGDWTVKVADLPGAGMLRKDWVAFGGSWQPPAPAVAAEVPRPAAAGSAGQPSKGSKGDSRTPAERLSVLKDLKESGLISEEEFRSKRLEILNSL